MGRCGYVMSVLTLFVTFNLGAESCPTRCKLAASLVKQGYSAQDIKERINRAEVRARMRQAKQGLEYEGQGPWWPNDPRYPVPYLFYREGQFDFGFGRW